MKGRAGQGETRQRLFEAAIDIFNERGFAAASTQLIVERAKITKPALYYYFKNKENLYREIIHDIFTHFNNRLSAIAAGSFPPVDKLIRMVSLCLDDAERKSGHTKLIMMTLCQCDVSTPRINLERYVMPGLQSIARVIEECMRGNIIEPDNPLKLCLKLIGLIHIQVIISIKGLSYLPLSKPRDIVDSFINSENKHHYQRR
jgi:AcrR family transcriptional regulator